MPIKDLSENIRLPRLGKIRLGVKAISKSGKEYPQKADHFVLPKDHSDYKKLVELYGETPKELPVLIPVEDEETWATQYFKSYNLTYGLVCKGDGETAMRMVSVETGELPGAKKPGTVRLQEIPCAGRDCPDYQSKKCHEVMNLRFMLPEVPGLGVWQIDTGSKNSIFNINSCARIIKRAFGRICMIPLNLTIEPIQVNNPENGKKQTVYVLNLRTTATIAQLADAARKQAKIFRVEAPDIEAAFDIEVERDANELWGDGTTINTITGEIKEPAPKKVKAETETIIEPVEEASPQAVTPENSGDTEQEPIVIPENMETLTDMRKIVFQQTGMQPAEQVKELGFSKWADVAEAQLTPKDCYITLITAYRDRIPF